MNSLTELLDMYDTAKLKVDRCGFMAATDDVDFAIIRHTDSRQAVWYDRDVGFRIASWNPDVFGTSCCIETVKNKRIAYEISRDGKLYRVEFDFKRYEEDEYFQVGLVHDISDLSFENFKRFYDLVNACSKLILEVKRADQ